MNREEVQKMSYNDVLDKFREVTNWRSVEEVGKIIKKFVKFTMAWDMTEYVYWIARDQPFDKIPENEEWYSLTFGRDSVVKEACLFLVSVDNL